MAKTQEIVVKRTRFVSARPHLVPCIIAAAMLLGALGKWPYGYYRVLRWVVCAAAVFTAYCGSHWKRYGAASLFIFLAILFNPLEPIHLSRPTWQLIDVLAALAFVGAGVVVWKPASKHDTFWKNLRLISQGRYPFYWELQTEQIALYQHYFKRMLNSVDIQNLTDRSHGREYRQESYDTDYAGLDIILCEAEADGLIRHYLQVLFEQYVWADVLNRISHKDDWVITAMRWHGNNFIIDPDQISRDMFVHGRPS